MELFVKQNQSCCFQTVNDRFTTRKWATFASKVAEFLIENNRVFFEELAELVNGWLLTDNYAADGRAGECMAVCRQTIK